MKIFCNGEYYKLLKLPETWTAFLEDLKRVCAEELPANPNIHYIDYEGFPIRLCNEEHYQVMQEDIKNLTKELLILVTSDENKMEKQFEVQKGIVSTRQSSGMKIEERINEGEQNSTSFNSPLITNKTNLKLEFDAKEEFEEKKEEILHRNNGDEVLDEKKEKPTRRRKTLARQITEVKNSDKTEEFGDKVEKKVQTTNVRYMKYKVDKAVANRIGQAMKSFQEKWKQSFLLHYVPEGGALTIEAIQERLTKTRFKPNTLITDESLLEMLKEFLDDVKEHKVFSIVDFKLELTECPNVTKTGISDLMEFINKKFTSLISLSLDFSVEQNFIHKIGAFQDSKSEKTFSLSLKKLENLELSFKWRSDIQPPEINKLCEEITTNMKNLTKLKLELPLFYSHPAAITSTKKKLSSIGELNVS